MKQFDSKGSLVLSVVQPYLAEIETQEVAKMDPINGLDPESNWISISAMLLYGILNCSGHRIRKR